MLKCIFVTAGITGNPNVGFTAKDLEGDFDPDHYDAAMATAFSDDYYTVEGEEEEKPVFSDEDGRFHRPFMKLCTTPLCVLISIWLCHCLPQMTTLTGITFRQRIMSHTVKTQISMYNIHNMCACHVDVDVTQMYTIICLELYLDWLRSTC